jgi:hypothetical protein
LELTRRLGELADLGHPLLVALSNKDFVGETLDVPLDQRLEGSLAAAAFSVVAGASILRVHEVQPTVRVVRMVEAILGRRPRPPPAAAWPERPGGRRRQSDLRAFLGLDVSIVGLFSAVFAVLAPVASSVLATYLQPEKPSERHLENGPGDPD